MGKQRRDAQESFEDQRERLCFTLVDAARLGQAEEVADLLGRGWDERVMEAMEAAVAGGQGPCVKLLLASHGEASLRWLEQAAKAGCSNCMELLLDASGEMEPWALLHFAHMAREAKQEGTLAAIEKRMAPHEEAAKAATKPRP